MCEYIYILGLGNISNNRQHRQMRVCNNQYRRHFHINYIAYEIYRRKSQYITVCAVGLSAQIKYLSTKITNTITSLLIDQILQYSVKHLFMVNMLMMLCSFKYPRCNISNNHNVFVGNNLEALLQYRPTLYIVCVSV